LTVLINTSKAEKLAEIGRLRLIEGNNPVLAQKKVCYSYISMLSPDTYWTGCNLPTKTQVSIQCVAEPENHRRVVKVYTQILQAFITSCT